MTLDLGDSARAGIVVTGSYCRQGAEIHFLAQVVSIRGRQPLGAVASICAPLDQPIAAMDALRPQVAGILTARFDPWRSRSHAGFDPSTLAASPL